MAIVVDPDLLNRNEVIFGTTVQETSLYPVGAVVNAAYDPELADGTTTAAFSFNSATGGFIANAVAPGDILSIKTGSDAGHWAVSGVISATELKVTSIDDGDSNAPADWADTAGSSLVYDIREPTGGNAADGATEQAMYSFNKEEWRSDGELFGGDDLIRHEFPFEPLTRESFEIGGGTSHDNWNWFSNDTKERVRTGGWDTVNSATDKLFTYTGVITLGSLESDAQVYYQPSGVDADPINFVLPGAVNQAILVHDPSGTIEPLGFDTRSFLQLFARKKAFTYDGSNLTDIGVTTLENIVNRFPLSHVADPAITADDAELEGHDPWTNFATIDTGSNGVSLDVDTVTGTLTAAGENFDVSGIAAGDVVEITGGTLDNEFFEIISVNSATELTLDTTEHGGFAGESSLTYETHRRFIITGRTDGVINEALANPGSGNLQSATAGFNAAVAISDIVRIQEASGTVEGVYKVLDVINDTTLGVDTSDQAWPDSFSDLIDFEILEPGMFLQSKDEDITISATTTLAFADADPDTITRAVGSWVTDGVIEGDVITITGAANAANNSSFVVRSVAATILTLDVEHALTAEGAVAATPTVARHFVREINGIAYPFLWRCYGNGATIAEVFEFIQKELRQTTDIDNSTDRLNFPGRGDVTDLLMTFASPNGKGLNMFIDNFDANDSNNITFDDAAGVTRTQNFVAAGTITHNTNLVADPGPAVVRMFFSTNPGGDFGTSSAIIVNDNDSVPISYTVSGASRAFTFDYDGNIQGGRSAGADAAITIVAIGLDNAQYVLFTGTITRSTGQVFALVSPLERTYSNP